MEKIWANSYETEKIYMGRIPHDSDLLEQINNFCFENDINIGTVNIIGAVKHAKVGYYSQDKQIYRILEGENLKGGLEIVSCTGNISIKDAKPFAHIHIVLSNSEGKTFGGHLMPETIVYAGEFVIQKSKGDNLVRSLDETTKLPLWQLSEE
ncbi:MAG: PPC domain-containing DNA-binding protein [bacterium]